MPRSVNPLKRKTSSPFSTAQRKKPASRKSSVADKDDAQERLDDIGRAPSLAPRDCGQDVGSLVNYIRTHAFEDIPERAAGMNSEQISATLRYRATLPPVVSVAHLHACSISTTETEREMARLIASGKLRKVTVLGRGKGGSAVGEGVVMVEDWKERLRREGDIDKVLSEKYIALMDTHRISPTTSVSSLSSTEYRALLDAGFLTNPGGLSSNLGDAFARQHSTSSGAISRAGYSAATGTLAAVGGHGAIHDSGASGSALATKDRRPSTLQSGGEMTFSLPSTGSYLKLLTEARLHLLHLLRQLSPRFKEATKEMLEEKWNGNVPNDPISTQKRMRGEWAGVLPGKTKRWRDFYGMKFEWILAECVGAGLVELFDTGSVGTAVRAT
ncbi:Hypothetical predicted protein [Lecanosticta acicola]|uniref:Serine-threonine protein kinase 19 n=1 Tax=Lecanosticta acicola TaxID=111012 RepID=A0AAI8YYT5_9PEZI|nr:Hypothetical predicted protein [Lecanosticta acicola]